MAERMPCPRCKGCGQLANSDSGEPWTDWLKLPLESALAVFIGLVRPVTCPACGGTGFVEPQMGDMANDSAAAAPERHAVECTIEFGGELEPPPNLLTADTKVLDDATMDALEDQAATQVFADKYGVDVDVLVIEAKRAFSAAKVGHEFEDMVRAVLAAMGIEVRE